MIQAIADRRSIRKYRAEEVPRPVLEEILNAGRLAPSSKNRQPWRFVVVRGKAKTDMLAAARAGLAREKRTPLLPGSAQYMAGAEHTVQIMEQAPVIILILNTLGLGVEEPLSPEDRIYEICNAQSIGAAIENMTLTATELGLGSLWICDTYFAHRELNDWLNTRGELTAALAIGYGDETPEARPRKAMEDIVEWRE